MCIRDRVKNDMISSIAQMQAYGTVALRLREVMDERGITRNELARSVQTVSYTHLKSNFS